MKRIAVLAVAFIGLLALALPASADELEKAFSISPEVTKFINDFKVKVKPTNVEIYGRYCSPEHPLYEKDMHPDLRAVICNAQYSGALAVELQNQRAENEKMRSEIAKKNTEIVKKDAEIAKSTQQLMSAGKEIVRLAGENEKLKEENKTALAENQNYVKSLTVVLRDKNKLVEYLFGALVALGIVALAAWLLSLGYRRRGRELGDANSRLLTEKSFTSNLRSEASRERNLREQAEQNIEIARYNYNRLLEMAEEIGKVLAYKGMDFGVEKDGAGDDILVVRNHAKASAGKVPLKLICEDHPSSPILWKNISQHFRKNHADLFVIRPAGEDDPED